MNQPSNIPEFATRHFFRWLLIVCATLLAAQVVSFVLPRLALALEGSPRELTFISGLLLFIASIFMAIFHSDRRLSFSGFVVSVAAMCVGSIPRFVHA
jgi:hypothetical protein